MTLAKPYSIAKRTVWEAFEQVKANRGAAGIDDESIEMFEQNLIFTFRPRKAQNKRGRRFTNFVPAVSDTALKRMRKTVRGWRLHRRTPLTLQELAWQYNSTIRGWINYYETFHKSAMHALYWYIDQKLMQWARRKYKTLASRRQASADWLNKMKERLSGLFVYWNHVEENRVR